ncbi:hypothetical protein PIROE2DRAFT_1490 [Piromyces sp. E2]|nr:hypothetical protein PIROE2DRAFT_1490 [Piromyces sp. E2]|eukprot:OUM70352.1 hypothetical protein PIROE2DRAFT_1490 [Piromyces sp. E2]
MNLNIELEKHEKIKNKSQNIIFQYPSFYNDLLIPLFETSNGTTDGYRIFINSQNESLSNNLSMNNLIFKFCILNHFIIIVYGEFSSIVKNCKYDNNDLNDCYDENSSTIIKCNNIQCFINGENVTFSNNALSLTNSGSFMMEGSLNSQVIVKANKNNF